ncbi:hypothetical protein B0H14DRAFT_3150013 [Mycena olivaceomarginata]|nr:hypothetical protein B0H14DRAFT_3150013 [Mycena olivaceomarginata]
MAVNERRKRAGKQKVKEAPKRDGRLNRRHDTIFPDSRVPQFRLLSPEQIDVKCGMGNPGNGSRTTYPIWWAIGGIGGLTRPVIQLSRKSLVYIGLGLLSCVTCTLIGPMWNWKAKNPTRRNIGRTGNLGHLGIVFDLWPSGSNYWRIIVDDDEQPIQAGGPAGISARIRPTPGSSGLLNKKQGFASNIKRACHANVCILRVDDRWTPTQLISGISPTDTFVATGPAQLNRVASNNRETMIRVQPFRVAACARSKSGTSMVPWPTSPLSLALLDRLVFPTLGPLYACEVQMRALHQARRDELAGIMSACRIAPWASHLPASCMSRSPLFLNTLTLKPLPSGSGDIE